MTLPAPCWYCGRLVFASERWVAAHVVDGDPSSPRVVAHPACNERAKARGVGYILGGARRPEPAQELSHSGARWPNRDPGVARTGGR